MKELSKELLIQTEDLLRLEKENMNEQLEVAKNNKEVLDEIDRVIQCEKNLIELFQSNLSDHIESKDRDKKDAIRFRNDLIKDEDELKQRLIEIEQDDIKNDPAERTRCQERINSLYRNIELDKELIADSKKAPRITKKAIKACKSLIKRHTNRLERLTELRESIQSSIDYKIGDAEISRKNIEKYEAEIERYKKDIKEDEKEIRRIN